MRIVSDEVRNVQMQEMSKLYWNEAVVEWP